MMIYSGFVELRMWSSTLFYPLFAFFWLGFWLGEGKKDNSPPLQTIGVPSVGLAGPMGTTFHHVELNAETITKSC